MVVQLLGVIVAAILVAAIFSSLGLALVRFMTFPVRDRPSVFVAWSFLKAARPGDPLSVRIGRAIAREVDGLQRDGSKPVLRQRALGGLSSLAVAAGLLWTLQSGMLASDTIARVARNVAVALGLHGFLLLSAALPWRRLRVVPAIVLAAIAAGAVSFISQVPVIARWVHGPGLAGVLLVGAAVLGWTGTRPRLKRAAQARRVGLVTLALGAVATLAGVFTLATVGWTVGAALVALGAYLLLSSQPKVTVPVFVSIVGVASGTWALIVVLSVMGGFAGDLREKMLVANAHALIERPGRAHPLHGAAGLSAKLRGVAGVVSVSPQVRGDAIVSSPFNVNNFVSIRGVDCSLAEVQQQVGGTVVTGALSLLARPERMGQPAWQVRRPAELPADLPAVPAPTPTTAAVDDGRDLNETDMDALLQMAPAPAAPRPPNPAPPPIVHAPPIIHEPLMLDSSGKPVPGEPNPERHPPAADAGADEALDDTDLAVPHGQDLGPALGGALGRGGLDVDRALPLLLDGDDDVDLPVAPGILLGVELARALQVELGDRVEVITPDADIGPTGLRPRVRSFRVAGTFETGLYEADSKVAYIDLVEASRYFNLEGAANVIELRLAHPEEPDSVLAALKVALTAAGAPADTELIDWRALNRSLFSALAFERLVIFLVLALIILVASFSIVSALTMVILQKQSAIAMLQAMGADGGTVRAAFVQMGGVIGMIGTTAGLILGLATCLLIDALGIQLPDAYYVRTLPVAISVMEVGAVVAASLVISLVATVFPAKSAARLHPLEGLRHE